MDRARSERKQNAPTVTTTIHTDGTNARRTSCSLPAAAAAVRGRRRQTGEIRVSAAAIGAASRSEFRRRLLGVAHAHAPLLASVVRRSPRLLCARVMY